MTLRIKPGSSVGRVPRGDERERYDSTSGHFSHLRFHNENEVLTMTGSPSRSSARKKPRTTLPAQTPSLPSGLPGNPPSFTWFGHSSFLLRLGGRNILVDPVFSARVSPVDFAGPGRFSELPLPADALPAVDVLFLSHDHYDHLDYRTVLAVRDRVAAFVVPLGVDAILRGWGVEERKLHALDWWESAEIGGVRCTLTPSQHFSGRNPLRRNRTLWGGLWADDGTHRVYYTGDGGYSGVFREIRERLGAPELMIAECGQYDTAWAKMHMFPEETVRAGLDVQAGLLIPVHWGSFCICNHAWDDSVRRVTAAAQEAGLPLATPRIGQTTAFSALPACTERWWEAYE